MNLSDWIRTSLANSLTILVTALGLLAVIGLDGIIDDKIQEKYVTPVDKRYPGMLLLFDRTTKSCPSNDLKYVDQIPTGTEQNKDSISDTSVGIVICEKISKN